MTDDIPLQYRLDLMRARLNDVCNKVSFYLPIWGKKANAAEGKEQTHVRLRVEDLYDVLDVFSFLRASQDTLEEMLVKEGATNSRFENDMPRPGDIVLFRHRIHPTLGDEEEVIGRVKVDAKGLHAGNRYLPSSGVTIIQKRRE